MTTLSSLIEVLNRGNYVILDTETTGLDRPAEICQIAIVSAAGDIEYNTLVSPRGDIPQAASNIHGITKEHTANAPDWTFVRKSVLNVIKGKDVIIYNAVFDRKMMHLSDEAWSLPHFDYKEVASFWCAMEAFAEWHGERHPYYGTYVWQKLAVACRMMSVPVADTHTAAGDAVLTWMLCKNLLIAVEKQLLEDQDYGADLVDPYRD